MRARAYLLPAEVYSDLEAQILEQIREADRDRLSFLVDEHDLEVELLSGEWRLLLSVASDYFQAVSLPDRRARLAVSPEELEDFAKLMARHLPAWAPIAFGLTDLYDAMPKGAAVEGLVLLEEPDDWMWTEKSYEMHAIRPEVWTLLEQPMRALVAAGDHAALARLCSDHAEGTVEFSEQRWATLLDMAHQRMPELFATMAEVLVPPALYSTVREGLSQIADPQFQPSLDAWLRTHADAHQYALYFRDLRRERE